MEESPSLEWYPSNIDAHFSPRQKKDEKDPRQA
jgi:hypothetical protein